MPIRGMRTSTETRTVDGSRRKARSHAVVSWLPIWAENSALPGLAVKRASATGAAAGPDGVVLSGDLSSAPTLIEHLELLAEHLALPCYVVLGNHDYYGGSIAGVRARMRALTDASRWLRWLPACALTTPMHS